MRAIRWLLLATASLQLGCLLSDTRVFEFDVIRNTNLGQPVHVQDTQHHQTHVELIRSRTYEESQGDIEVVDRAGFAATIQNLAGAPGRLSLYLGGEPDLADPDASAIRLISLEIPPDGKVLTFAESEDRLEHAFALKEAIEGGDFHLYVRADAGSDLRVDALVLVVSMTVSP